MVCTSCGLAFHLDCVRPVATEFPTDPAWRCAYCVLSTEPKNTKKRRESAAAVRLMARLRNGNRRRKARQQQDEVDEKLEKSTIASTTDQDRKSRRRRMSNSNTENATSSPGEAAAAQGEKRAKKDATVKDGGGESLAAAGTTPDDKKSAASAPIDPNSASNSKKRNLALFKLADAFTGEVPSPDGEVGRGKRSRKQPTLYDPQMSVPARSWQSDEVDISSDSDTDDSDSSPRPGREVADGDVWCGFCNDDPLIKLCCFCGCRKCFGKHKKSKLLICDECDDEYHTFCLTPPLHSLPSRKWFCPTCKKAGEKKLSTAATTDKTSRREAAAAAAAATKAAKSSAPPAPAPPQQPRKRGRPPKNPDAVQEKKPTGRKRGRPPKNASASSISPPPRKRGRPPSKPPQVEVAKPKPLRAADGRFISPKSDGKSDGKAGSETMTPRFSSKQKSKEQERFSFPISVPVTVSRSGRTVKRTSFHDEIEEGEQHLRSDRDYPDIRTTTTFDSVKSLSVGLAGSKSRISPLAESSSVATTPGLRQPPTSPQEKAMNASSVGDAKLSATKQLPSDSSGRHSVSFVQTMGQAPASASRVAGLSLAGGRAGALAAAAATSASMDASSRLVSGSKHVSEADLLASQGKTPRRKPGARECVQISRRFGTRVIPEKYSEILLDYCSRGKVEHLIRMRERLDEHSRFLELQLAGLEQLVKEKGESNVVVPVLPEGPDRKLERTLAGDAFEV